MKPEISDKTKLTADMEELSDLDTVDPNRLPCPIGALIAQRIVDIANGTSRDILIGYISDEDFMISGLIDMSSDVIPDPPIITEGLLYCILEINQIHNCIGRTSMSFNASMDDATIDARIDALNVAAIQSLIIHDKLSCTCSEHKIELINAPTSDLHYTGFAKV